MSKAGPSGLFVRWLKRAIYGAVVLVVVVVFVMWVNVVSFDTESPPERQGQLDARLFAKAGPPRPLLVAFGGAEGGNAWTRDRWASQRNRFDEAGYAFLALGYFGLENTPENLDRIALDAVVAAIADAQKQPQVSDQCVVLLGGSRGAELVLALAAHEPARRLLPLAGVIALSPSDTVFPSHTRAMTTSAWSWQGQPLPFAEIPWAATGDLIRGNLNAVMTDTRANEPSASAARIPVENIDAPILLISSSDDEMWPASAMADSIAARLLAVRYPHAVEHLKVPGNHIAVINHFARVEGFLAEHIATQPQCRTPDQE